MNKQYLPLLPFLALALLSLSNISYAQSAYTSVSAPGSVYALSQQGRIMYSTPSSSAVPNYFLSGTNGSTSSSVSLNTASTSSQYSPGLSVFSYSQFVSPWSNGSYNTPNPLTGPMQTTDPGENGDPSIAAANSINDNGQIAANLYMQGQQDGLYEGNFAGIANLANNTVTLIGGGASVYGLNSSGVAVFNYGIASTAGTTTYNVYGQAATNTYSEIGGAIELVNSNTGAVTTVQGLGYGGSTPTTNYFGNISGDATYQQAFNDSSGINAYGQVTGGFYTSTLQTDTINYSTGTNTIDSQGSGATRAFRTGDNGSGTQVFGTANGISSMGTAINSSGQIGGYITLSTGQTEAFLSTARGGLMVGLGAGASTDSSTVEFLNDNGQAIVYDSTTGIYYLYSAGYIVPVSSLTGLQETVSSSGQCTANCVVGFNNLGQILLDGNTLLSPTSSSWGSATTMSTYSGATLISSTSQFSSIASAQNGTTPTSTFYTDPSTSTSTITTQSVSTPGPATIGLMLLALMTLGGISLKRNHFI